MSKLGEPFSLFERASNPDSKWLIVGEAPGEDEEREGRPFIGASGKLLNTLLAQAGFEVKLDEWGNRLSSPFHITNVFTSRPPENDLKKHWTVTKTELKQLGYSVTGRLPKLNKRFIHPEHEGEVARLHEEIRQLAPTFILALGGTALWALTGESRITVNRGALLPLELQGVSVASEMLEALATSDKLITSAPSSNPPHPCPQPSAQSSINLAQQGQCQLPQWAEELSPRWLLPSFHPAMVLRQWDNRPLLWADLLKARRFLSHQLPPPLRRHLWIDPSIEEVASVYEKFRASGECLGVDIETDPRCGLLTTISFATAQEAICIPFYNKNALATQCNYWKTAREEAEAWRWVMRFAALANPKVLQNGLYDHQYLLEQPEIRLRNADDDTAILQHTLQPELPKALGTLASLYINEPAWKLMREGPKDQLNKADE